MGSGRYESQLRKRGNARARHVWLLYWVNGMTMPEIALMMGRSKQWVSELIAREQRLQDIRLGVRKNA